ncbi:MAG: hypothetical protein M9918_14420 [Anaerolineae bacterium]|nr:hypothetical protein [Anaerolineae bacterium]
MDINEITTGQAKEMMALFGNATTPSPVTSRHIGKYVIVRSRNEGINAGEIVAADETGVVLKNARRLWYHRPNDKTAWYEGVANSGLRQDSKVSAPVREKAIIEDYSITLCTAVAEKSIREFASYEQQN